MTTDEAFQEQFFLQEKGASVDADFDLFNFEDLLQSQEPKTLKERKKKQKNLGLLNLD